MKTLVKIALIISLALFTQMYFSEQLQMRGRQLFFLRNLPHRSLGLMFWSWQLQPHRSDLLAQYAIQWHIAANDRETILEGMSKPVVPILVAKEAGLRGDDELLKLSKLLLQNELKKQPMDETK